MSELFVGPPLGPAEQIRLVGGPPPFGPASDHRVTLFDTQVRAGAGLLSFVAFYVCLGGTTAILSANVVDRLLGRLNECVFVCRSMCVCPGPIRMSRIGPVH